MRIVGRLLTQKVSVSNLSVRRAPGEGAVDTIAAGRAGSAHGLVVFARTRALEQRLAPPLADNEADAQDLIVSRATLPDGAPGSAAASAPRRSTAVLDLETVFGIVGEAQALDSPAETPHSYTSGASAVAISWFGASRQGAFWEADASIGLPSGSPFSAAAPLLTARAGRTSKRWRRWQWPTGCPWRFPGCVAARDAQTLISGWMLERVGAVGRERAGRPAPAGSVRQST